MGVIALEHVRDYSRRFHKRRLFIVARHGETHALEPSCAPLVHRLDNGDEGFSEVSKRILRLWFDAVYYTTRSKLQVKERRREMTSSFVRAYLLFAVFK